MIVQILQIKFNIIKRTYFFVFFNFTYFRGYFRSYFGRYDDVKISFEFISKIPLKLGFTFIRLNLTGWNNCRGIPICGNYIFCLRGRIHHNFFLGRTCGKFGSSFGYILSQFTTRIVLVTNFTISVKKKVSFISYLMEKNSRLETGVT